MQKPHIYKTQTCVCTFVLVHIHVQTHQSSYENKNTNKYQSVQCIDAKFDLTDKTFCPRYQGLVLCQLHRGDGKNDIVQLKSIV